MSEGILNPIQQLQADFDFDVYTKQEVDTLLDGKADKVDTYTKTETDALLNEKADVATTYTKTETNDLLNGKADKSTTLAGYGITDAYTKAQTDNLLNGKADTNSVYTKEETDNLLSAKANSADVYTKTETNNLLSVKADSANVYTKTESNTLLAGKANVDDVYTKTEIDNQLTVTKDGTWVKGTQTTATNLEKLEGGIEYLYGLLSYKYSQLRKYINGNYYDYETNTDTAYTKTVPAGAMPYAGLEKLGGKTVAMNQLVKNGNFANGATTYWYGQLGSITASDNELTYNVTSIGANYYNNQVVQNGLNVPNGHVIFLHVETYAPYNNGFYFSVRTNNVGQSNVGIANAEITPNTWCAFSKVTTLTNTLTDIAFYWSMNTNYAVGDSVKLRNCYIIDLTLMFGSGNEPTTVEQFREMFPAEYYPYNAGELLSAGVAEVESVGVNLIDDGGLANWTTTGTVTFPCHLKKGITYTVTTFNNSNDGGSCVFYDADNSTQFFSTTWSGLRTIGKQITPSADMTSIRIYSNIVTAKNIMVVRGNTKPTTFVPYMQPKQYPIPTEIQALEGYGWSAGTAYNYIDYERKVFVQNVGRVDLGSLTWAGPSTSSGLTYFRTWDNSTEAKLDNRSLNLVCDKYVTVTQPADKSVFSFGLNVSRQLNIFDSSFANMTATQVKEALSGVYLYYEKMTPIETDISVYLTDDNLISVESGGTLTFPNSNGDDYRIPVPSTQEYMINLQEAVSNG